jgi:S1-C subfamily serine protease
MKFDSGLVRTAAKNVARKSSVFPHLYLFLATLVATGSASGSSYDLTESVARIKPSIVGVGTFQKTRNPSAIFVGTGFAIADGQHVVTNAHVLPREVNVAQKESLIVLIPGEDEPSARSASIVALDRVHDLALLRFTGDRLPALPIGDSKALKEGQQLAFTGFPIGMALGLYPATHRATLAALVPIARAGVTAKQLNPGMIKRLRDSAYVIFQLDATAYPGNSGSPLFDPATATVYGIINSVFIQGTREQVITRPSGITYAIPSAHIRNMLEQAGLASSP